MSSIRVRKDEFYDVVMAIVFDSLKEDNSDTSNERWNEFIKKSSSRGIQQVLYNSFVKMDGNQRVQFKIVKRSLENDTTVKISVDPNEKNKLGLIATLKKTVGIKEEEEFDRELCKQIFRKIKEVRFKHPSKVLTEDRIDKIIDYCVEQKKKQTEEQQNG